MRFHPKNELETIFNVQKCARHGAPFWGLLA